MDLNAFFDGHPEVAVAFSGGVDSAYLLYAASRCARRVGAYCVRSRFQPAFEYADAAAFASRLGVKLTTIELDVLSVPGVRENPPERCYLCKTAIFSAIRRAAGEDGFDVLLDGTNASDDVRDRPGMRALQELGVLSPLRLCGLHKQTIRSLAREAGIPLWDKPAYACLATRIPHGEPLSEAKLAAAEQAEAFLFSLGFRDFRVRSQNGQARIQLREEQLPLLMRHRAAVLEQLRRLYGAVLLDLEVRK